MKIFGPLYDRALRWAGHERAPTYLTVLSFIEAVIFPVMPEVMLMPMCVAQPRKGWRFGGCCCRRASSAACWIAVLTGIPPA